MPLPLKLVQSLARVTGNDSVTGSFPSTPTAGNTIIIQASWIGGGGTDVDLTITDDQGTITWGAAVTSPHNNGARTKIGYAYNIPAQGANPTITLARATVPATVHIQWSAEEWSGFANQDPLDHVASNTGSNVSTGTTTATAALSRPDALVVAVVQQDIVATSITVQTLEPPWVELWDGSLAGISGRGEADRRVVTAGGAQTGQWTFGVNTIYSASIAAFVNGPPRGPGQGGNPGRGGGNKKGGPPPPGSFGPQLYASWAVVNIFGGN